MHRHLGEVDGGNGVAFRLRQPRLYLADAEAAAFTVVDLDVCLRAVLPFSREDDQLGVDPDVGCVLVLPYTGGDGNEEFGEYAFHVVGWGLRTANAPCPMGYTNEWSLLSGRGLEAG